jgi:serine/threonine protein kinase
VALPPGTVLGDYTVVEPLTAPGPGATYLSTDATGEREVLLHVVGVAHARDSARAWSIERTARAVARLSHANIAAIHAVGRVPAGFDEAGAPYFVTERVEGHPLQNEMRGRPMPVPNALTYARQIALALAAAEDAGLAHGALSPVTILIGPLGQVKLVDFGLVRLLTGLDDEPAAPASIRYRAPEQLRGENADHRSDIFALGALVYEMLTGQPAFSGGSAEELTAAILTSEPSRAVRGAGGADVPLGLQRIVFRCLAKDPADRFQSASGLTASLEEVSVLPGPAVIPRPTDARGPGRRRLVGWAAVASSAATLLWMRGC